MPVQLKMLDDGENFELLEPVSFRLDDGGMVSITVPAGFVTDLASIPAVAGLFGFDKLGKHSTPAILHDFLFRSGPDLGFEVANAVFLESMRRNGTGSFRRTMMASAVQAFGRKNYIPIEKRRHATPVSSDVDRSVPVVTLDLDAGLSPGAHFREGASQLRKQRVDHGRSMAAGMAKITFPVLRTEYRALWETATLRGPMAQEARRVASRMIDNRARYETVSRETSVPWWIIGVIHALEAGQSFAKHLHNGDSLAKPTWQVPAGRPRKSGGPFTWEESAADALRYDNLDKVSEWSIERTLYELECYNGTGYRRLHPECKTPYLWSGTTHYASGKYVEDGQWSSEAVSKQPGAVAILKCAVDIDVDLFGSAASASQPAESEHEFVQPEPLAANSFRKAVPEVMPPQTMAGSSTGNAAVAGGAGSLAGIGIEMKRAKADAVAEAAKAGTDWSWADVAWNAITSEMVLYVLLPMIGAFVYTWLERRRHLKAGAY